MTPLNSAKPFSIAAVFLAAQFPAFAAEQTDTNELPNELQGVVVTANRYAESADDALVSVSVIDRKTIEASGASEVTDLLRTEAGVDVARSGPIGGQTSVFLRGANSDHVLVLIDGVRVAAAGTGSFVWEHLSLDHIERIEIVRGPRAAQYGSDAIGGVIQIFTRDTAGAELSVGAGSFDTQSASARVGTGDANNNFQLGFSRIESEGFSARNNPASFGFDPDDDGYDRTSINASFNSSWGENARMGGSIWAADTFTEFDAGTTDRETSAIQLNGGNKYGAIDTELQVSYSRQRSNTVGFNSLITSTRWQADWVNTIDISDSILLLVGADYYHLHGDEKTAFGGYDENVNNRGLFVGVDVELGRVSSNSGVRVDRHSRFGTETTGNIGLGVAISNAWDIYATYGTAFIAPDFNELFSSFGGDPNVDPETSKNTEIGVRWTGQIVSFDANLYRNEIDNLISTSIAADPITFQLVSVPEALIRGFETNLRWQHKGWNGRVTGTIQRARDARSNARLLRRAESKFALALQHTWDCGLSWSTDVLVSGDRVDFNNVNLDGYTLWNMAVGIPLGNGWALNVRADNLLDDPYEYVNGFNTAGRSIFTTLSYKIK